MEEGYASQFLVYIGRDATYKSSLASDGYATGIAVFVTRQAGLPASDARLQRGLAWLKSHQRASGRWYTPSQAWHTQHLIANAGTAYAVLALFACGELPAPR
jgi:squalene-hopene/tetraprenyl-beta-curcumene cyclase